MGDVIAPLIGSGCVWLPRVDVSVSVRGETTMDSELTRRAMAVRRVAAQIYERNTVSQNQRLLDELEQAVADLRVAIEARDDAARRAPTETHPHAC